MNTSSTKYWEAMEMVCNHLNLYFQEYCSTHPEFEPIKHLYLSKKHLNGMQFYAGYKAALDDDGWLNNLPIPIIIELTMIWAYKTNQIIDDKKEVWSSKQGVKDAVLEHDLLLSLILQLEEEARIQLGDKFQRFNKILSLLLTSVTKGFWVEKNISTHFHTLEIINQDWEAKYLERNRYLNALYDYAPVIGYWVASYSDHIFTEYEAFFSNKERFSGAGQIGNDFGDWSQLFQPTERSYQDRFADIRNGLVTYPIHELLENPLMRNALDNPDLTHEEEWQASIRDTITKSKLYQKVKEIGEAALKRNTLFWREYSVTESPYIYSQLGILISNKYLTSLKEGASLSMVEERVVLVNSKNEVVGTQLKSKVHTKSTPLHRGFSVYLFNDKGEVLVQQRSHVKKTWPLMWAGSCCGHPALDESLAVAIKRRLAHELGIIQSNDLQEVLPHFRYRCERDGIVENEICPVWVGKSIQQPVPNSQEVEAYEWVKWEELINRLNAPDNPFAKWCYLQVAELQVTPSFKEFLAHLS